MKLISHRGNTKGRKIENENDPQYIYEALNLGFDCEIDVWFENDQFYLGHDEPKYKIKEEFLTQNQLWCHAKNLQALHSMLENKNIHCFWHQSDDFTLTSKGYIWTYPNKELTKKSICMTNEFKTNDEVSKCFGVCSDEISKYKNYK